jgi:hypothetical protein
MKKTFALTPNPRRGIRFSLSLEMMEPKGLFIEPQCERARLSDLVPIARKIGDTICQNVRKQIRLSGKTIPCRKGCAECCKYLVPVSTPEAVHITEDILALPSPVRQQTLTSLVQAAKVLLSAPAFSGSNAGLSLWYSDLEIICPMLKDYACSLYSARPIACREHLAVGSSCEKGSEVKIVEMPVSVVRALADVAAEMEETQSEAVILPLAPAWYESNSVRAMRTWPAEILAERFATALSQQQTIRAAAR